MSSRNDEVGGDGERTRLPLDGKGVDFFGEEVLLQALDRHVGLHEGGDDLRQHVQRETQHVEERQGRERRRCVQLRMEQDTSWVG